MTSGLCSAIRRTRPFTSWITVTRSWPASRSPCSMIEARTRFSSMTRTARPGDGMASLSRQRAILQCSNSYRPSTFLDSARRPSSAVRYGSEAKRPCLPRVHSLRKQQRRRSSCPAISALLPDPIPTCQLPRSKTREAGEEQERQDRQKRLTAERKELCMQDRARADKKRRAASRNRPAVSSMNWLRVSAMPTARKR